MAVIKEFPLKRQMVDRHFVSSLLVTITMFAQPAAANVSLNTKDCANPESVESMNNEIWAHIGCTKGKNMAACANYIGVAATIGSVGLGGAVAANLARGSAAANARNTPLPSVCGLRRPVGFNHINNMMAIFAPALQAVDCTPHATAIGAEVDRLRNLTTIEMEVSARSQATQMQNQLGEIADAGNDLEYRSSVPEGGWDANREFKKFDRAYRTAVDNIDQRSMGSIAGEFEKLSSRLQGANSTRAKQLIQEIRSFSIDDMDRRTAAYRAIDELADLHGVRRTGSAMLGAGMDPGLKGVESAIERRTQDLVQEKKFQYRKLAESGLKPDTKAGMGKLWLDYSPVEKYELSRMKADASSSKLMIYQEGESGRGGKYLRHNGLQLLERRYPMMSLDPRIQGEWVVLRQQEIQLLEMISSHSQASSYRGLAGTRPDFTHIEDARRNIPNAPVGSKAALEGQVLKERLKLIEAGKGFAELPAEVLANLGKQAAASGITSRGGIIGGSVIAARMGMRGLGVMSGVFGMVEMASAATGAVLTGVEKVTGRDDINCSRQSPYVELDMSCNPTSGMNSRMMKFLSLPNDEKMKALAASPQLCDQLKEVSATSSAVENWSAQCSAPGEPKGFTLVSRHGGGQVKISGSPMSTIELVGTHGNQTKRVVSLDPDGTVSSIRVPRPGVARNATEFDMLNNLSNPRFYRDIDADDFDKAKTHVDRDAVGTAGMVSSLWYAQAEVAACCSIAAGDASATASPSSSKCAGYLGDKAGTRGGRTGNGGGRIER